MDPAPEGFEPLPAHAVADARGAGRAPGRRGGGRSSSSGTASGSCVWIDGGRPRAVSRNGNDLTGSFPELRASARPWARTRSSSTESSSSSTKTAARRSRACSTASTSPKSRDVDARRGPRSGQLRRLRPPPPRRALAPRTDLRRAAGAARAARDRRSELGGDPVVHRGAGRTRSSAPRSSSAWRASSPSGDRARTGPGSAARTGSRSRTSGPRRWSSAGGPRARGTGRIRSAPCCSGSLSEGTPATLTYVGKVGTGFSRSARERTARQARGQPSGARSPFAEPLPATVAEGRTLGPPATVGEVRFSEWTPDGRLRHPVWRGPADRTSRPRRCAVSSGSS